MRRRNPFTEARDAHGQRSLRGPTGTGRHFLDIYNGAMAGSFTWPHRTGLTLIGLLMAAVPGAAQPLPELMREARPLGDVPAFENDYVRVYYGLVEYPAAERDTAEHRPVVLSVRVSPHPGIVNTRLLLPPRGARPLWRPGVMPRTVHIEVRSPPPPPPELGTTGTDLPLETVEDMTWEGGRLSTATFQPQRAGAGAGRYPSVTIFLSDGVVEVANQGLRRRMAVQAGDAFWFDAATRIMVVDDYPVGVAIVQLTRRR